MDETRPVEASTADDLGAAGYLSVDAMVALLIVSMSIILGLQAIRSSHQVSTIAAEYKSAQILMAYLIDTGPRSYSETTGVIDGFAWSLVTQPTGLDRPIAVCRRALSMRAEHSGRAYQASTREICPAKDDAP